MPAPKGFRFIHRGNNEPDIFIHWSILSAAGIDEIALGTRLRFSTELGPDGWMRAKRSALADD